MKLFTLIAFVFTITCSSFAQLAVEHDAWPSLQFRHVYARRLSSWFVDYVEYKGKYALRIPVHHYHAACNGYFYLNADSIAYSPTFTPKQNDGFDYSRSDLKEAKPRFAGVDLYFSPNKRESFAFISEPEIGSDAFRPDQRDQLLMLVNLAFRDYAAAERQFLAVLAGRQSKFSLQNDGVMAAQAPSIVVLPPPYAEKDAPIDVSGAQAQLSGVATGGTGVREVKVNGQPTTLTRLSPEISMFQSTGLPLRPGVNDVVIGATFANGSSKQMQTRLNRQEIAIDGTSDFAPLEVTSPTVRIAGKITGIRGVEDVQIGGVHARIQHAPDGTVLFDTDEIDIVPGAQDLQGTVQSASGEQPFVVRVERVKGIQSLSFNRVEEALRRHIMPLAGLRQLVQQRGVNFQLDDDEEARLRSLGADSNLILAIYKNRR